MQVTKDHLLLLMNTDFDWAEDYEWGGISQDQKRPFGNSDVIADISSIIGRTVDHAEAQQIHIELAGVLNLMIVNSINGKGVQVGDSFELPWRAARAIR